MQSDDKKIPIIAALAATPTPIPPTATPVPPWNVAKTHLERKLETSGCQYELGEVQVREQRVTAADKAEGVNSKYWVIIEYALKDNAMGWQDRLASYTVVNGRLDHPQSTTEWSVDQYVSHCTK